MGWIKKCVGALLMVSGLAVLFLGGPTAWSYFRTSQSVVGNAIRDNTPTDFELERLAQAIRDVEPGIANDTRVCAQLDVEVESLKQEIQTTTATQDDSLKAMLKLRMQLVDTSKQDFEFGDRRFTRLEVELDLERRLARYEEVQGLLVAKKKMLTSHEKTLAAASENIRAQRHQQQMLADRLSGLRAEWQLAQSNAAAGSFSFDQSAIEQAKQIANLVEKRVRTEQKVVDSGRAITGEIAVDTDERPITEKFDAILSSKN